MAKKTYNRPLMSAEQFIPNESISACWHIEPNKCYSTLYHDVHVVGGSPGHDGIFNWITSAAEENMYNGAPHGSGTHRVPSDEGFFKTDPAIIPNDGYFYRSYAVLGFAFTDRISQDAPIYMVTDANGKKHYFSEIANDGNHS